MYCRYLDDCFIATSTQSEIDECFRIMNEQSPYIKLTRQTSRNGWLPYLNVQVKVCHGIYGVKWYRKDSCKNILIHATSAHPSAVKRAVVRNMFRTAAGVCTGAEERQASLCLARKIADLNGYTSPPFSRRRAAVNLDNPRQNKVPLCIPFISDKFTAAIQRCIARARLQDDVMLVHIASSNIKSQLVRNRLYDKQCVLENCVICPNGRTGDCAKAGVIYQIVCRTCNSAYIGETGRMLAVRLKEHLAGKRRSNMLTPLGKYRVQEHNGNDYDVKCTILALETDISSRKALEAFWISARNPSMNNRSECVTNK